jgi:hypothetical protein
MQRGFPHFLGESQLAAIHNKDIREKLTTFSSCHNIKDNG